MEQIFNYYQHFTLEFVGLGICPICSVENQPLIVGDCLLSSYILSERLNDSIYQTFWQEVQPEKLNHVPKLIC